MVQGEKMSEQEVKIVKLDPMQVICFNGFGEGPEQAALAKLFAWAQAHGKSGRVFGYNNPNPSPGSPNYGYDAWMVVDEAVRADEGEARLIDFPGGLYAVLRCPVEKPWDDIPAAWQKLVLWRENSRYQEASHQWLEEHIDPHNASSGENFTLDLFLPIKE
jgi:AraC family transcriptional regulator